MFTYFKMESRINRIKPNYHSSLKLEEEIKAQRQAIETKLNEEMLKSKRDFRPFMYKYPFGETKLDSLPFKHLSEQQYRQFAYISDKMIAKSNNRIKEIEKRIYNDVCKGEYSKRYQIKSHIEYKKLKEYCKTILNDRLDKYELEIVNDPSIAMNKLNKIIDGNYICCSDCSTQMKFVNVKIPVIYCHLVKKK